MRSADAGAFHYEGTAGELIREMVRIPGTAGKLSGELAYPISRTRFAAVLVNPHPHMCGRTGNRVVKRVAEVLASGGGVVLTFDYSGVGESEGAAIDVAESMARFWKADIAPEDPMFLSDAACAVAWLRSTADLPLVLIGYSFGAFAATAALSQDVRALILIAPTVEKHDFTPLDNCAIPKLIIYGEGDFATPEAVYEQWFNTLSAPRESVCVRGGDHFFRGREDEVAGACMSFVEGVLAEALV